jgi:hypothetical protein
MGAPVSTPEARNRRAARVLLAWITFLMALSVLVAWVRN